jgi:hypothetical protein
VHRLNSGGGGGRLPSEHCGQLSRLRKHCRQLSRLSYRQIVDVHGFAASLAAKY